MTRPTAVAFQGTRPRLGKLCAFAVSPFAAPEIRAQAASGSPRSGLSYQDTTRPAIASHTRYCPCRLTPRQMHGPEAEAPLARDLHRLGNQRESQECSVVAHISAQGLLSTGAIDSDDVAF